MSGDNRPFPGNLIRALLISGNTLGTIAALSSGTIVLAAGNNITLSQNGQSLSIIGGAGGAGGNINISAGATSNDLTNLVFADSKGVTFGLNGSTITATVATNYAGLGETVGTVAGTDLGLTVNTDGVSIKQANWLTTAQPVGAYLTTARASNDAIGLNTAKTNVTWTVNSAGLSFDAGGYAGTGFTSTSTAGLDIKATQNTAGLSMGVPAYLTTQSVQTQMTGLSAGMSDLGQTFGTSGAVSQRIAFVPWGAMQFSQSVNGDSATLSLVAIPAVVSNLGNTSGNTGAWLGQAILSGGNNITLSVATLSQTFSGVTRTNAFINISALSFSNANGVTFGTVAGTLTASVAAQSNQATTWASYWRNAAMEVLAQTQSFTQTFQGSTSYIQPFVLDVPISASYLRLLHSFGASNTTSIATTANATGSCSICSTIWAMIYTNNIGASSLSLKSVASASAGITQVWSLSANANGSQYTLSQSVMHPITGGQSTFTTGVTTSLTNYSLGSLSLTIFTGLQILDLPFASTLNSGNYWLAYGVSSSTAVGGSGANFTQLRLSQTMIGASQINNAVPLMGQATASSIAYQPGIGSFSTNAIGTTASLDLSRISSASSLPLLPFGFFRTT